MDDIEFQRVMTEIAQFGRSLSEVAGAGEDLDKAGAGSSPAVGALRKIAARGQEIAERCEHMASIAGYRVEASGAMASRFKIEGRD